MTHRFPILMIVLLLAGLAGCDSVDRESSVPFVPPLLQSSDPSASVTEIRSVEVPFTDTDEYPTGGFVGYAFSVGGGTLEIALETSSGVRQSFALYGPRPNNGVWGGAILQRDGRDEPLVATRTLGEGRYLLLVGTVSGQEVGQYTLAVSCGGDNCVPEMMPCPDLDCTTTCPLGFVMDGDGCPTCQCVSECTSEFDCPGTEVCNAAGECVAGCQCNQALNPVCGADGETYANECEASCAGVEVVAFEACSETCPPTSGCELTCENGLATDSRGCTMCECRSPCDSCTSTFQPVCSFNGRTYINRCEAECSGEVVSYPGQCRSECPALDCALSCPDGFQLDAAGCPMCTCKSDFSSCPNDPTAPEMPVCGENGATYPSLCEADQMGVGVVYDEVCPGYTCRSDTGCPLGTVCLKPDGGATCLSDSNTGECLGVCIRQQQCDPMNGQFAGCPEGYLCVDGVCESSCACSEIYDPVCGNDGITYDNACIASCAGARLVKVGRCCQPLDGCMLDCPNGYELDGNQCAICQCRTEPPCACTDLDSPVCVTTVDGQTLTYRNQCWAQCDGHTDIAEGRCP